MSFSRKSLSAVLLAGALTLSACAGENADAEATETDTLRIDYATYNPLSLIIKDQGWLEDELDGDVEWVYSAASNKANENLRAEAIDVGSAAGSVTLTNSDNRTTITNIDVYEQMEWAAVVVHDDSDIASVADLRGKKVAATLGTDPLFLLVQARVAAGVDISYVEVQYVQHA